MPCRKKLCITLTACGLLTFNMSKMNSKQKLEVIEKLRSIRARKPWKLYRIQ